MWSEAKKEKLHQWRARTGLFSAPEKQGKVSDWANPESSLLFVRSKGRLYIYNRALRHMAFLRAPITTYQIQQLLRSLVRLIRLTDVPTNVFTYPSNAENNDNPVITFWSQNNANGPNDEACSKIPPHQPIVSCGGVAGPRVPWEICNVFSQALRVKWKQMWCNKGEKMKRFCDDALHPPYKSK